jgi:hypothetical protein
MPTAVELLAPAASLVLDDEIVAIALKAGRVWPSVLPTLLRADAHVKDGALDRGLRSLRLRGQLGPRPEDPLLAPLEEHVDVVLRGRPVLSTYLGMSLRVDLRFSSTVHHRAGTSWLSEVITPLGAHYLLPTTGEECRQRVADLFESVRKDGLGPLLADDAATPPGMRLWAIGQPCEGVYRVASATPGELRTGSARQEDAGLSLTHDSSMVPSGEEVVNFLLTSPN